MRTSPWPCQRTPAHGLLAPQHAASTVTRGGGGVAEGLREVKDAKFLHPLHVLLDPHGPLALVVPNHLRLGRRQRGRRAA